MLCNTHPTTMSMLTNLQQSGQSGLANSSQHTLHTAGRWPSRASVPMPCPRRPLLRLLRKHLTCLDCSHTPAPSPSVNASRVKKRKSAESNAHHCLVCCLVLFMGIPSRPPPAPPPNLASPLFSRALSRVPSFSQPTPPGALGLHHYRLVDQRPLELGQWLVIYHVVTYDPQW